ncbi:MAG TPA: ABC transporter [Candidatus Marinimicrobia bacterium]|nr:MAG: ABC transporter [Candidatus Marinimicrobia bacterium CG_4_10_14_0_2_um_filter_48_9]PJA54871.1 MAG: ABC transporter [Candidatus Marinimicrobia bacterium CG_4_9_14_3_um_filter_48_9]HCW75272.1 ABC transporter [Candidatus Neomarinimicrobiota bacterium]
MRNFVTIFRRELNAYFVSPMAYVVMVFFFALASVFFYLFLASFLQNQQMIQMQAQQSGRFQPVNVNLMLIRGLLMNLSVISLFMIPMITMRSFSEDRRNGTMELLLTSPLTNWQIILGKYFAALTLYAAMIGTTLVYMVILFVYGDPELLPIISGYLGLFLFGAALVAIGIFVSSLTENQLVAALVTFVVMLLLWLVGALGTFNSTNWTQQVLQYLSTIEHLDDFVKGVFDTRHLVYYVTLAFFGLFLTYQSVESTRWRG